MYINDVNSVNFQGLWEAKNVLKKETGSFNKNKVMYKLYEFVYHPYENETKQAIAEEVNKHFWGRSFSLWDKFDGQHKADLYHMNFIKIGNSIKESEAEEYTAKGLRETFSGGVPENKEFYASYTNETYAPYDVSKMTREYVEEIASRHFDLKI